jgi:hypothetical protein
MKSAALRQLRVTPFRHSRVGVLFLYQKSRFLFRRAASARFKCESPEQRIHDTSHLGIVNSPQTWQSALEFLSGPRDEK